MGELTVVRTATVTGAATFAYMLAPTWELQFMGPPETAAVFVSHHGWLSGMASHTLFLTSLAAVATAAATMVVGLVWRSGEPSPAGWVLFAAAGVFTVVAALVFGQVTAVPLLSFLAAWLSSPWAAKPSTVVPGAGRDAR